jgi:hypothetical protein
MSLLSPVVPSAWRGAGADSHEVKVAERQAVALEAMLDTNETRFPALQQIRWDVDAALDSGAPVDFSETEYGLTSTNQ